MNPYSILGVPKEASQEDIKKAFYRLAKELHPDANRDLPREEQEKLAERFKQVTQAHHVLSDMGTREIYDSRGGFEFSEEIYSDAFERNPFLKDLFNEYLKDKNPNPQNSKEVFDGLKAYQQEKTEKMLKETRTACAKSEREFKRLCVGCIYPPVFFMVMWGFMGFLEACVAFIVGVNLWAYFKEISKIRIEE